MRNYVSIKRNLRWIALIVILMAVLIVLMSVPPDEAAQPPEFSVESGFYDDAFYLEITAPEGCRVYYTLDGSVPDKNAILYCGPIYIEDASSHENTNSMNTEITAMSYTQPPDFLVDKCTVIRAVAIAAPGSDLKASSVVTKTYFVGFAEGYFDNCNLICLATDPDNFFDKDTGIYVTGSLMEDCLSSAEELSPEWEYWPANYRQKGREWEREANLTFFQAEGTYILSKDAGVRIQGGWSRAYVPRSLNLYARTEYDAEANFKAGFFPNSYAPQTMTLFGGGNQGITQFNDYMMSQRVRGRAYAVMTYTPYVLFLNGEYWGFYWLTEKYDDQYIQYQYNLGNSDVVMMKDQEIAEGSDEDLALYNRMVAYISSHDMSDEANYAQACAMIDMDSFLDYYATMIYIARCMDWPNSNEALWRTREVTGEPYADGKWRWMLYDCNSECMSEEVIDHDTLTYAINESALFGALWNNASFRDAFKERLFEIADACFDASEMQALIHTYEQTMVSPLSKSWARFHGSDNTLIEQFTYTLDSIETFFNYRRAVVESWFEESGAP